MMKILILKENNTHIGLKKAKFHTSSFRQKTYIFHLKRDISELNVKPYC